MTARGEHRPDRVIVFLRHGVAEDAAEGIADFDRSLTTEGHARMKRNAAALARVFPRAEMIYTSPLLRAMQTALWVSKAYRGRIKVEPADVLRPASTAADVEAFIDSIAAHRIVIVGHEPLLSDSATRLLRLGDSTILQLKKGGCCAVRLDADGRNTLDWFLAPRVLDRLAD